MLRTLTTWALLLATPAMAMDDCPAEPERLGAFYTISREWGANTPETATEQEELKLWRAPRRAAHQHPDREQTELWEQAADGRVRLVRLFDSHQRGIEYQPGESGADSGRATWQRRRELVTPDMLDPGRKSDSTGSGCDIIENYRWEDDGVVYELDWLPRWRLVSRYLEHGAGQTVLWRLVRRTDDAAEVDAFFARIDDYLTTDYADIGDNESDPFLQQMIRLGFITDAHEAHRGH